MSRIVALKSTTGSNYAGVDGMVLSTANSTSPPTTGVSPASSGRRSPQPPVRRPSFAANRIVDSPFITLNIKYLWKVGVTLRR
jgi:hypothetical protein